jgi:hypothetical protein
MLLHTVTHGFLDRYGQLRLVDSTFEPVYGGVLGELKPQAIPLVAG